MSLYLYLVSSAATAGWRAAGAEYARREYKAERLYYCSTDGTYLVLDRNVSGMEHERPSHLSTRDDDTIVGHLFLLQVTMRPFSPFPLYSYHAGICGSQFLLPPRLPNTSALASRLLFINMTDSDAAVICFLSFPFLFLFLEHYHVLTIHQRDKALHSCFPAFPQLQYPML